MSDKEYRAEQIAREAAKRLDEVRAGSSKSELLPCPFCGGEAEILTAESMHGGYLSGIMCNDCRSRGDVYDTEAEAIEAWNTRAPMSDEDLKILLDELGVSERTCHPVIAITEDGGYEYALCSECDGRIEPEDNYCPNCGARVVEK